MPFNQTHPSSQSQTGSSEAVQEFREAIRDCTDAQAVVMGATDTITLGSYTDGWRISASDIVTRLRARHANRPFYVTREEYEALEDHYSLQWTRLSPDVRDNLMFLGTEIKLLPEQMSTAALWADDVCDRYEKENHKLRKEILNLKMQLAERKQDERGEADRKDLRRAEWFNYWLPVPSFLRRPGGELRSDESRALARDEGANVGVDADRP